MYTENQTDARTFPQIWASLTKYQRDDLSYSLLTAKCTKTRQTIWNWGSGRTMPNIPLVKEKVAQCVSRVIGLKTYGNTLFPPKVN